MRWRTLAAALALMALLAVPAARAYVYGSQVQPGDSDFRNALLRLSSPAACRLELGDSDIVHDDGFYLLPSGGTRLRAMDLRLTPFEQKAAGTLVSQSDVVELQPSNTLHCDATPTFCYADLDGNGRFGLGDYAYVSAEVDADNCLTLPSKAGNATAWSVRVTPTPDKPAGALVIPGDMDWVRFRTSDANQEIPSAAVGHSDLNGNARLDVGDRLALSTGSFASEGTVRLTAGTPGQPPVLLAPAEGAMLRGTSVQFTWQAVAGAESYELKTHATGWADFQGTYACCTASLDFSAPAAFTWSVWAANHMGAGPPSSRTFTVDPRTETSAPPSSSSTSRPPPTSSSAPAPPPPGRSTPLGSGEPSDGGFALPTGDARFATMATLSLAGASGLVVSWSARRPRA